MKFMNKKATHYPQYYMTNMDALSPSPTNNSTLLLSLVYWLGLLQTHPHQMRTHHQTYHQTPAGLHAPSYYYGLGGGRFCGNSKILLFPSFFVSGYTGILNIAHDLNHSNQTDWIKNLGNIMCNDPWYIEHIILIFWNKNILKSIQKL